MSKSSAQSPRTKERLAKSYMKKERLVSLNSLIETTAQDYPASTPDGTKLNGRTRLIYTSGPMKYKRSWVVEEFVSIVATLRATLPEGTNLILWAVLFLVGISVYLGGNWLVWQAVASSRTLS